MDNDTPTIESTGIDGAFDAAMDAAEATEEVEEVEVEETEAPEEPVEESTEEPSEEVDNSEEEEKEAEEESFTSLSDEEIPDALKPLRKQLQADYTKKRQAEAERLRELERQLEEISSGNSVEGTQTSDEIAELVRRSQQGDEEAFNKLMQMDLNQKEETVEEKIDRVVREKQESAYAEEVKREYPNLDSRLNEHLPDYDNYMDLSLRAILAEKVDQHVEKEGTMLGFDYKSEAQALIKEWDKYLSSKNKAYALKQSEMAKKKSEASKKKTPKTTSAPTESNKKMTLEESMAAAAEELGY